jgi:hypothetical protein
MTHESFNEFKSKFSLCPSRVFTVFFTISPIGYSKYLAEAAHCQVQRCGRGGGERAFLGLQLEM